MQEAVIQEELHEEKIDMKLWRQILRLAKPYKRYIGFAMLGSVGMAAGDALFPYMTRIAIDRFIVPATTEGLGWFAVAFAILVMLQSLNIYIFIKMAGKVESGVTYTIRQAGFEHLHKLSFSFYDKRAAGWLLARLTSDVNRLGEIVSWSLVDLLWGGVAMIFYSIVMFSMNWRLALLTVCVLPILAVVSVYFQRQILRAYRNVRRVNSKITGAFSEGIMGATTTKILSREEKNLQEFQTLTSGLRGSSIRAATFSALYLPIVLMLGSIGTSFTLWAGGNGVVAGTITYGVLVAFASYTIQFFDPVREIARIFAELQMAHAAAERVMGLINTEPEIQDRPGISSEWPRIEGAVEFENVSFAYNPLEPVLVDFDLKVKPGQTIALVGETGSGKSTIVNLACRFYEPTAGRVLIDGVDYRDRPLAWLQSNLGYVLQSPQLFSGSIRENIRYGRLQASDSEVERAAELVNAHEFITRLPRGYDTEVGEGGDLLSTGQKQLISFARAILAAPRIFVLDEATSSIDTETEMLIQDAIRKVLKGRTSFIIAHRLSTVRSADLILVIRGGKVQEKGNHNELMAAKGYYYRLYTNQFLEG
ncbi:MAG: ABC transporter ATP-binding protein/permease [Limnochordia bacterium]|nr:ABC transporter ATP-binding protein/permease [Limnochordia bacterium]